MLRLRALGWGTRRIGREFGCSREVALVPGADGEQDVRGRVCAVRKTGEAIALAHAKLRRKASKGQFEVRPETFRFAEYVIVFTTFPAAEFAATDVLEAYRVRWQVELVFKRFKSLADIGHLPRHDEASARPGCTASSWSRCWSRSWSATPRPFPPGAAACRPDSLRSPWRDFRFAFNQAVRAVEPDLPLARVIGEWNAISESLADSPRHRPMQIADHFGAGHSPKTS